MIDFLIYLIISVIVSFGMAVALVEKGDQYPIRKFNLLLRKFIHDRINWKFSQVIECTTCASFWTTLVSDIILFFMFGYFFWPFSGFVTVGFTWFIIEFLNAVDNKCE